MNDAFLRTDMYVNFFSVLTQPKNLIGVLNPFLMNSYPPMSREAFPNFALAWWDILSDALGDLNDHK